MPQRENSGPRLELRKHAAAEQRIKAAILEGREPDESDLELVRRKTRERGPRGVRRVLEGGGDTS